MTGKRKFKFYLYIVGDYLLSVISWALFFWTRKSLETGQAKVQEIIADPNFYYGLIIIPLYWVLLYGLFEEYEDIYRKSRSKTGARTFFQTLLGSLIIFFFLILDDVVDSYQNYYRSFLYLFIFQFAAIFLWRLWVLTRAKSDIKKGIVSFNTLLLGNNQRARECYEDIVNRPKSLGLRFIGYLDNLNGQKQDELIDSLPYLGDLGNIEDVVSRHNVEEVIVALDENDQALRAILTQLFSLEKNVLIKIIPHLYDILLGQVKMNHLYGPVLIEIEREIMPRWQRLIKRIMDIVVSFGTLLVLSPVLLFIALRVRLSSPGPILYKQERVGLGGREFRIYKFRSMWEGAEKSGPQLSHESDERVTPWGAIMRKYRLDELPQFWNVLIGDMSIVGPRPERRYYIDQIAQINPHYSQLLKVRPGITSWGMVKYGYASNIDQMLHRLKFDLLYIENRSLALDFKILFYTLLVIVKGDGK